ncbi:hypothetical protein T440DRAFT_483907 [Plenodomus tracheiphilus IPT5]|uniref:Heterokaryon incompatibility domain-containing protein n=1 Tax=Plenodomus tracheiphilus IPT5 TaxID=1408161 RepID=A0A6A7ARR5_9PLEO|nr:hypothetical protein T440DRAFT_483907 [Plenodomus tracheiphilus IPT5]
MAFWTDSICIDQSNVKERGSQVRLMNSIYRSAEFVGIWLGPSANDSDIALDMMRQWKPKFDDLLKQNSEDYEKAAGAIQINDTYFYGPQGSRRHRTIGALYHLVQRQWWKRAWVVQEGSVAQPSRTILCCGDREVDWDHFRAALIIARRVTETRETLMSLVFTSGMAARLDDFRTKREAGDCIKLLNILNRMRLYRCEDPRDKVYAALGMAMDVYHASGTIAGNPVVRGLELRLPGSFVDRVVSLSVICQNPDMTDLSTEGTLMSYYSGQTVIEDISHTLIADVGWASSPDGVVLSRGFEVDWELVKCETEHLNAEMRIKREWMLNHMKSATFGRRFFTTTCGYMGLAPAAAQINDCVCVLFGGQVLYLLRDRPDGRYEFVGECYVHGMMDGEACDGPWFERREFVIV